MPDLTGQQLGDFQLLRLLGRGAMASVYLAEQRSLARRVAVKVLSEELSRQPEAVERFKHEARAAASLVHPGIVQVYEVGTAVVDGSDRHYLAQEYVPGGTLGMRTQRDGAMRPADVLDVLWQVGAALDAAAARGLVHRDIKPDNLMVDRSGAIKVADFGLARLAEANGPRMTQAGVAVGTPLYMSPEQIEGRDVDARSDLYSLGVTAFQLLTGDTPFVGDTPLSVAVQHLNNDPPLVCERRPGAPDGLAQLIDRLLRKDPAERFQSPAALIETVAEVAAEAESAGWGSGRVMPSPGSTSLATPSAAGRDAVSRLAEAMRDGGVATTPRWRRWFLAGLGLAGGVIAALMFAPRDRLAEVSRTPIERFEDARQQLFHAKLVNTPSAWRAVVEFHPDADVELHRLALRGAALSALRRDENRAAAFALNRLADLPGGGEDLVVAAARVVAYDRLDRPDDARSAAALLLAASDTDRQRLRRDASDLAAEATAALERLR